MTPARNQPDPRSAQAAYTRLLPADRVRTLSTRRWWRPVMDASVCWLLIVSAWCVVAWRPAWWTVLPATAVVGNRYYALFIIGHDGLHRRLFRSRWLNDRFADLLIFGPIGGITRLNNRNHLLHHAHLATEHDPDRHKYTCFNKASLAPMLGFVTGLTSVASSVSNVFLRRPAGARPVPGDSRYRLADGLLLAGWQLALVVGLTSAIAWWAYPVMWLLPVYAFMVLGDNLRSFCEHSHPEPDALADRHRLITYHSPAWERWLIAPMNMNFHTAHHLWPTIPYYNLPRADRELRSASAGTDLVWRGSYLRYLLHYFGALPLEACRAVAGRTDHTQQAPPARRAA